MKTPVRTAAAAMAVLALCACGQRGGSDSSTASAATFASQPSTSKDSGAAASDGMMTLLPTGNLVIQVPGDTVTGATTTYDDGMQQTYYDSRGSIPLTVAVEHGAAGSDRSVHPAQGHPRRRPWRIRREPSGLADHGDPAMAAGP